MSKAFDEWWLKAKLPEFDAVKLRHYSEVRRIAMKAYNAGKKREREERVERSHSWREQ